MIFTSPLLKNFHKNSHLTEATPCHISFTPQYHWKTDPPVHSLNAEPLLPHLNPITNWYDSLLSLATARESPLPLADDYLMADWLTHCVLNKSRTISNRPTTFHRQLHPQMINTAKSSFAGRNQMNKQRIRTRESSLFGCMADRRMTTGIYLFSFLFSFCSGDTLLIDTDFFITYVEPTCVY